MSLSETKRGNQLSREPVSEFSSETIMTLPVVASETSTTSISINFQFAPTVTPHTYESLGPNSTSNMDPSMMENIDSDAKPFSRGPSTQKRRERKQNKDPDHVPRPPNAFIMWRQYFVQNEYNAADYPSGRDLSKITGDIWNELAEPKKQAWKSKAAAVKAAFDRDHPNYKYKPNHKEKKEKKEPVHGEVIDFSPDSDDEDAKDGNIRKRKKPSSKRPAKKTKFEQTIDFSGDRGDCTPPLPSPDTQQSWADTGSPSSQGRHRANSVALSNGILRHARPVMSSEEYRSHSGPRKSISGAILHTPLTSPADSPSWSVMNSRGVHTSASASQTPIFRDPFVPLQPVLSPPLSSSEGEDDSVPAMSGPASSQSNFSGHPLSMLRPSPDGKHIRQHSYADEGGQQPIWGTADTSIRRQSVPTYSAAHKSNNPHPHNRFRSSKHQGRVRWSASAGSASSSKSVPKSIDELHSAARELKSEYPAISDEESSEDGSNGNGGSYYDDLPSVKPPPISSPFLSSMDRSTVYSRKSSSSPNTVLPLTWPMYGNSGSITAADARMSDAEDGESDDDGVSFQSHDRFGAMRTSELRNIPI